MRKIDFHIGEPLCWLLAKYERWLGRLFAGRRQRKNPRAQSIIIMKFFGVGSILLSAPLTQFLRARFPDAKICFLSFKENEEIIRLLPTIDEYITLRQDSLRHFILDTLSALRRTRSLQAYATFDLEFFSRYSALFSYVSGAIHRIGFHISHSARGQLLTHRAKYNNHHPVARIFLAQGEDFVGEGDPTQQTVELLRVGISPDSSRRVENRLRDLGIERYVVLSPGIGVDIPERKWDPEKWSTLAGRLTKELGLKVIFSGGPKDVPTVREITKLVDERDDIYDFAGTCNLLEFLALLKGALLLVSTDSAAMHLGVSIGTPTVALFGPETPKHYGYALPHVRIMYLDLVCSPCYNIFEGKRVECPYDRRCMREITVDHVWNQVCSLLSDPPRTASQTMKSLSHSSNELTKRGPTSS